MLNKLCRTLFIAVTLAAITSVATSAAGTIDVTSATYGASCRQPHGNVTDFLKRACDGSSTCNYTVRWQTLGDPAVGCGKDFSVDWRCSDGSSGTAGAPPEAGFGSKVALTCSGNHHGGFSQGNDEQGGITVTSATYGASCRQPHGNVTDFLKQACDGKSSCDYTVRWQTLGDPAVGCGKDFSVDWRCDDGSSGKAGAAPEAGFGSKVALICPARGAHR